MNIVVQDPLFLFSEQKTNFNGYNYQFFIKYCNAIYTNSKIKLAAYIAQLIKLNINPLRFKFILSESGVNEFADVLISFNGRAYRKDLAPSNKIKVMKIWHVMDYADKPLQSSDALSSGMCDYVMGYSRHDLDCSLFKAHYSRYSSRVIDVPFGFGKRFINEPKIDKMDKIVALGAINKLDDDNFPEVNDIFGSFEFSHPLREFIRKNITALDDIVYSQLPPYAEEKTPNILMEDALMKHSFFLNDLSVFCFPPARTYEGISSGSILLGLEHPAYERLGFVDGRNCILLNEISIEKIKNLNNTFNDKDKIESIRKGSLLLSKEFTHEKVADKLYKDIVLRS